jgi:uncharacterized RDD family membrane protein YckC
VIDTGDHRVHINIHHEHADQDTVSVGSDAYLAANRHADSLVAVFGSATSDGDVTDSVVSIFGHTRVNGPTGDSAVAVLGNNYVNSKVGGTVVAVLGDVELGPLAEVDGDVVTVGGTVTQDPSAVVHGSISHVFSRTAGGFNWLHTWVEHCLLLGRPLAIAPGLGWAWILALSMLAFYTLLAAFMPKLVNEGVDTLVVSPGPSVLTSLLSIVLTPIAFILLCVTIIGIIVVPFLAIAVLGISLLGNAVVLAAIGRGIFNIGGRRTIAAWLAVLVGGLVMLGLYLIPILGFMLYKLIGILGFGVVIYSLILKLPRRQTSTPAPDTEAPTSVPSDNASAEPAASEPSVPATPMTTMPRAGFFIRMAALVLDSILVGIVLTCLGHNQDGAHNTFLIALALYGAVMWKMKGTTIGGIICGLTVVRLDGKPLDWPTVTVRALSCFLSLVVAGLGFFWICFSREHQAWHDKIAGTVVVYAPKGHSLV